MVERKECSVCGGKYSQILDHVRKEHNYGVSVSQAVRMGIYVCGCGAVVASRGSVVNHQARMKDRCSEWVAQQDGNRVSLLEEEPAPDVNIRSSPRQVDGTVTEKFMELAGVPGVVRPLNPIWSSTFRQVVRKLAVAYMEEPSDEKLYDILALPKAGLGACMAQAATGNRQARSILAEYPRSQPQVTRIERSNNQSSVSQRAQRYVQQGRLGTAARTLNTDSSVLPLTHDVINALKDKHPVGENEPFARWEGDTPGSMPEDELVETLLRQFKPDTAAGISGWTHALTTQAFKVDEFKQFFNLLIKQVVQNKAPGQQMLCASRLTPLAKPDGGVRPIAVGELFYRLIMKCVMRKYFYRSSLHPFQLGVGSKGGVEPIVYAVDMFTQADTSAFSHVISLDFSNAFNTIKRSTVAASVRKHLRALYRPCKWAYGQPTPLVVSDGESIVTLKSSQGVRQGDPLGPLLFSLGIKDILGGLQDHLGDQGLVLAYLDDVFVFTQGDLLDDIEDYFRTQDGNLKLNRDKCSVVSRQSIIDDGMELLGTVVGSKQARVQFLRDKIAGVSSKLIHLNNLPSQHSFLLLTRCIQQDLRHLQRTLWMGDAPEEWDPLDNALWDSLKLLRGSPRVQPWDEWIFSLPSSLGGMGIPSHREIAPLAYETMADTAEVTLKPISDPGSDEDDFIVRPQRQRCAEHYGHSHQQLLNSLTHEQQNIMVDNGSKLGRKWMTTIPFNKALELSDGDISVALHIRTLCPGQNEYCLHCGNVNEAGHDDICNSRPNRRLARHEYIKNLLIRHIESAPNTKVLPEPMTKDGNSRTDFRITGPPSFTGGQSEYDLSITAPTAQYKTGSKSQQQTLQPVNRYRSQLATIEHEKVSKYTGKTYSPFRPVVMSLGGTLASDTEDIFKHWRKHVPHWDILNRRIAIGLVKARSTYFEL